MSSNQQLVAVALAALLVGSSVGLAVGGALETPTSSDDTDDIDDRSESTIEQFDSEAAFVSYLRESNGGGTYLGQSTRRQRDRPDTVEEDDLDRSAPQTETPPAVESTPTAETEAMDDGGAEMTADDGGSGADRHSETNVQEAALDEPDIVKTDGQTVYYAGRNRYHSAGTTHVFDVDEPATPSIAADIPASGELLLDEDSDSLVIFERNRLRGYDVTNRDDPDATWHVDVEGRVEAARLYDGDVYLVVAERVRPSDPCPVRPLGSAGPEIDCTDVSHPPEQTDADTVYTTMRLDPTTGEVTDETSFLGSSQASATYVSETAVYLTYENSPPEIDLVLGFLLEEGAAYEHMDERTIERLERLEEYDLSDRAKQIEFQAINDDWLASLDDDERRDVENALEDDFESYVKENSREFTQTGVVKVGIDGDLAVDSSGSVPGTPLNQFSMDEHDGHLRIATTIRAPEIDSENDLYVLDEDLETVGEVTGMGIDERIYSVRYEGDTAYVVTFREIDPFHVIDVADPHNPTLEGELKLPGFSTYMHPLGGDRILGIGEEDGKVKAVIFDASDPQDPVVEDDVILDDRWSAVSESHTAFLIDQRHGVFFLPGSEGGHVFGYEDGLNRVTTVETDGRALRAIYLDDYLYVFGDGELVVVDETTWETETRLNFGGDGPVSEPPRPEPEPIE